MDSDVRQDTRGAVADRGGWYFIKGIPVAVIVTLIVTLGGQSLAFVLYLKGIENRVENVSEKQAEHKAALDRTNEKLDALAKTVQESSTPSVVNAGRIASLESSVAELKARLAEAERKQIRAEALQAALELRNRASRER